MSQQSATVLERLLRGNDLGWMIDLYTPKDLAIPFLLELLDKVTAEYRHRIGVEVPFTPEALTAEAERNPHKVRAFLQTLTATQSLEMLVMVWRILQGLSIRQVGMKYQELEVFSLFVVLRVPGCHRTNLKNIAPRTSWTYASCGISASARYARSPYLPATPHLGKESLDR